ncbi:hypothetical protein ACFWFR_00810 [Oerskovia sp. NPDC060287]|uniref:hypothetical protein n=1 Tax=Oerskovia sp. NPDC060287 TaxID=3347095 RepID=UPI003650CA5F
MATSPRRHTVPAAGETPRRQSLNDLAGSINDPVPVPNVTARAQLVADLAAQNPPYIPSTTRPLYVHRTDAGPRGLLEKTNNGTAWEGVAGIGTPAAPTLNSIWVTDPEDPLTLYQDGAHMVLSGGIRNAGSGSIGTPEAPLGSIPATAAPATRKIFAATFGGDGPWSAANVVVYGNGDLRFNISRATATMAPGAFILAVHARWLAKVA